MMNNKTSIPLTTIDPTSNKQNHDLPDKDSVIPPCLKQDAVSTIILQMVEQVANPMADAAEHAGQEPCFVIVHSGYKRFGDHGLTVHYIFDGADGLSFLNRHTQFICFNLNCSLDIARQISHQILYRCDLQLCL